MAERYQVAIIGGSMGGVAAALAAADAGAKVVLTESTDWIGGQMTSQGVSAFDEHPLIETFGGTRSYMQLRNAIRTYYHLTYNLPEIPPGEPPLNPGNGWVSRLCFEPRVGLKVLRDMLAAHVHAGNLRMLLKHHPIAAKVDGDRVLEVTLRSDEGQTVTLEADYFLDATDLGDLLPLTGTEYVTGAEANAATGEPHAYDEARPGEVQSFTHCLIVEYVPGGNFVIPKPMHYEEFRHSQPFLLGHLNRDGSIRPYRMFEGERPFWTYRRLYDASLLGEGNDIALINWAGNDYHYASLIDQPEPEGRRIIQEAKNLSLSFLYYLQTEAPRDEGGVGFPELRLRPDVTGTDDGLAKSPYIRESRRIVALKQIVEQEIAQSTNPGGRAAFFADSVGIGHYPIDLHACVGNRDVSMYDETWPFQIPLGALIPRRMLNLIAACKNIGTTHLTNGAYRLHPVEWNIGESAGALAAYCAQNRLTPREVRERPLALRQLQERLLGRGIPLCWTPDTPPAHPDFIAAQTRVMENGG
jgi:hypothetical protein